MVKEQIPPHLQTVPRACLLQKHVGALAAGRLKHVSLVQAQTKLLLVHGTAQAHKTIVVDALVARLRNLEELQIGPKTTYR